jgi:hypothetical protein
LTSFAAVSKVVSGGKSARLITEIGFVGWRAGLEVDRDQPPRSSMNVLVPSSSSTSPAETTSAIVMPLASTPASASAAVDVVYLNFYFSFCIASITAGTSRQSGIRCPVVGMQLPS